MKRLFWKSRIFVRVLSMGIILLASQSCKSLEPTTLHHTTQHYTTLHNSVDTVVLRDTVLTRDSIVLRERTIRDTVYITKEVYRDAHHSSLTAHNSTKTDTVVVTEWREKVIEHPPERYVPKFYKWCTGLLWGIGLLAIGYWLVRWRLR